jgi:hypothetical protein
MAFMTAGIMSSKMDFNSLKQTSNQIKEEMEEK